MNVGHLTHLEKDARNPSHKSLCSIADALDVPYCNLFSAYDKNLDDKQEKANYINYIAYDKIPLISKIDSYIECPTNCKKATFAYIVNDDSMAPIIFANSIVFVEKNGLIKNKEIGLFRLNNEIIIRKLVYKKDYLILKATDRTIKNRIVSNSDDFQIIGKIHI